MLRSLLELPEWHVACKRYRYNITRFAAECLNMTVAAGQPVTWQQHDLFTSIALPGSRTSVASGHGCFGIDTPIMLFDGTIKPVQDISLNDEVMGDDGRTARQVLDLVQGKENLYKFIYADGTRHVFNESHTLCLLDANGEQFTVSVQEYLTWSKQTKRAVMACRFTDDGVMPLIIKKVKSAGFGDYFGFLLDGNSQFLDENGTILHNTGKTRSAGIIALWHLLFFPESVMMFTAPQIDQLRKLVWKEISICLARMKTTHMAWLADYVIILAETVYVRGFQKTWHVIAKTAPKNKPTNLAGQHGDHYMLWVDEACGVEDANIEVAMGALTHSDNRAVLTSQPARPSGFFFDTHHKLRMENGGVWRALTFNGEESPLVSTNKLKEALLQYGSRDDAGYMIRIRGLFPDLSSEFLITQSMSTDMYRGRCINPERHKDYGYIISVDVGGGVGRDDSVITVAKIWGEAQWGERATRVEVIEIPLCKNRDDLHELTAIIDEKIVQYPNATLLVDANGAGRGLAQNLKSKGIYFIEIHWGGQCFSNSNREQYVNKRSQAIVCMSRAVAQGRLKVVTKRFKAKLEEQITRLPYVFDDKARYKVPSKEEMRRKGLKSPDMTDTLAFMFMEGINYLPAKDRYSDEQTSDSELKNINALADMASLID